MECELRSMEWWNKMFAGFIDEEKQAQTITDDSPDTIKKPNSKMEM